MNKCYFLSALLCFGTIVNFSVSQAENACAPSPASHPLATKLATAATFANLRNSEGSLRYESKKMLLDAQTEASKTSASTDACSGPCKAEAKPQIVFRSVPNKFLASYSDKASCDELLKQTENAPLKYDQGDFKDLNAFADQFSDFSQGKGTAGKDLYSKCTGACSPRYTTVLTPSATGYVAVTSVVCGPARDKDDNQYQLSAALTWKCSAH